MNIYTEERENFNQAELNGLIRDLGLSKELSELFMLQKETNVTFYRNKEKGLLAFLKLTMIMLIAVMSRDCQ